MIFLSYLGMAVIYNQCFFFYADMLNIASAHHCSGLTKVTEK